MPSVIILQRGIMHYRLPVFRRLYELFGWQVACSHGDHDNEPFILPFDIEMPDSSNLYRAKVPTGKILRETGAKAVISEFSLRMSSSYQLIARRRLLGGPITIFWSHGFNMDRGLTGVAPWIYQLPRLSLLRMADANICYSDEGMDFLGRFMPRDRLFLAQNVVDVEPMRKLAAEVGRVEAGGKPHIMTIGRILPDKDFPMLVRVFLKFRETHPEARLTIIGDGPDAERTRQAAGEELGRSVDMVGAEYDEKRLAARFRSSDLIVFSGAVGLSVNHALAYGIPVMAFERTETGPGHHPEIAYVKNGVTGYRVPEYTERALLEGLLKFFADHPDPRSEFDASIRDYVDQTITLDHMIQGFVQVHDYLKQRGIESPGPQSAADFDTGAASFVKR